jgi:hypothetical protein
VSSARGDHYAGEWPRERFNRYGIEYFNSTKVKSDLYLHALPLLMAGKVDLLDNQRLIGQLYALDRRTGRGGKDNIDHRPGAHDDLANACAGAIYGARETEQDKVAMCGPLIWSAGPRSYFGDHPEISGGTRAPHLASGPEYRSGGDVLIGPIRRP